MLRHVYPVSRRLYSWIYQYGLPAFNQLRQVTQHFGFAHLLTLILAISFIGLVNVGSKQPAEPIALLVDAPYSMSYPTLADFWDGSATFVVDVADTGLPMGESETWVMPDGSLWSYLHASDQSAGAVDQCGAPVEFPGCTVIYRSTDNGVTFTHDNPLVCQFSCQQCPCDSFIDHIDQQQYPDIAMTSDGLLLVHEYRGRAILRRSSDGLNWSIPEQISYTGIWRHDYAGLPPRGGDRGTPVCAI